MVIGREDADVTIGDPQISRRHAAVRPSRGGLEIEDTGSSNGTFVNGEKISSPTSLSNGDTVRVGTTELDVEIEQPKSTGTMVAGGPQGTVVVSQEPESKEPEPKEPEPHPGTVVAPKSPPGAAPPQRPAAAQPSPPPSPPAQPPPAAAPTPAPYQPPAQPPPSYTPPPGQGPAPYGPPGGYGPPPGPPTGPQYAAPIRPKGAQPRSSGSQTWIIALIAGIVGLLLLGLVLFLVLRSNDEAEIRATLEEIAENPNDPDTCDLVTQGFKEAQSGLAGSAADAECRSLASASTEVPQNVEVEDVDVNGDRATARVTGDGDTVTVTMVEEDGDWKLDAIN